MHLMPPAGVSTPICFSPPLSLTGTPTAPNEKPKDLGSPLPNPTTEGVTAFISGPLEPPLDYFFTHYLPCLRLALSSVQRFVIGPAPGIDTQALHYLCSVLPSYERITLFLTEPEGQLFPPYYRWFTSRGGKLKVEGATTNERDAAMTRESDYDILRYYTVEEAREIYGENWWPKITATERNEARRRRWSEERGGRVMAFNDETRIKVEDEGKEGREREEDGKKVRSGEVEGTVRKIREAEEAELENVKRRPVEVLKEMRKVASEWN